MNLVINTNVILVSLGSRSKYHWIFQNLRSAKFNLLISNEILFEYEEIVSQKMGEDAANYLLETIDSLPNVYRIIPFFHWNLIKQDPDDDKFVDCVISGNADHLITEDTDFNILKTIDFPKVSVLNIESLKKLFENK